MARKKGELGNAIRNARLRKQAELQAGGAGSRPPGGEAPPAAQDTRHGGHGSAHGREEQGHADRGHAHRGHGHR